MFCKITLTQSSHHTRGIEFLECVNAIATAAAGSTPTHASATIEVISNTEAGGWSQGTATNMVSSSAYFPHLTLLTDSGKTTKPYSFISFVGPNTSNQPGYMWTTFGYLATDTYPQYDGQSTDQGVYIQDSGINNTLTNTNNGDSISESLFAVSSTYTYFIACNSEFIHIQAAGEVNGYSGAWFHWGTRTHQSWEDEFNDNPYWVALWDHGWGFNNAACNGYWTSMRVLEPTNGTISGPFVHTRAMDWGWMRGNDGAFFYHSLTSYRFRYSSNQYANNDMVTYGSGPITSQYTGVPIFTTGAWIESPSAQWDTTSTSSTYNYQTAVNAHSNTYALQTPIHNLYQEAVSNQNGLTYDTSTSSFIPSASPMTIRAIDGTNNGGVMKYILQGHKFNSTVYYDDYCTTGATVSIDGTDYILTPFISTNNNPPNFLANLYVTKA